MYLSMQSHQDNYLWIFCIMFDFTAVSQICTSGKDQSMESKGAGSLYPVPTEIN